jgi:hypothetical protein
MAGKTENGANTDLLDSDQSARRKHAEEQESENWNEVTDVVTDFQTSNKSGKRSTTEKHVDGASGSEEEER